MEFIYFIVLSYKGLDNTSCIDIFLNRIIQFIILIKYLYKMRMCLFCNKQQCSAKKRDNNQEKQGNLYIDHQGHDPGKKYHDRCPCQKADTHHICHLDICNICCHSCDQSRCGEMVNIFEGKILYLVENIMTKIFCISGSCHSRHISCLHTKKQSKHRHNHKNHSTLYNISQITICNTHINDLCHFQRNEHFHQYLKNYKNRCQYRLFPVFPNRFKKCLIHLQSCPPLLFSN